jgi:hypothetical protein
MSTPGLRTKSITAKVTEEEYARLQEYALAQGQNMGELARELLLAELESGTAEETLLAEMLALRAILLNVVYALGRGEVPGSEKMRELIERADADKLQKARTRLGAARGQQRPTTTQEP